MIRLCVCSVVDVAFPYLVGLWNKSLYTDKEKQRVYISLGCDTLPLLTGGKNADSGIHRLYEKFQRYYVQRLYAHLILSPINWNIDFHRLSLRLIWIASVCFLPSWESIWIGSVYLFPSFLRMQVCHTRRKFKLEWGLAGSWDISQILKATAPELASFKVESALLFPDNGNAKSVIQIVESKL